MTELPTNLRFFDFHPKEENVREVVLNGLLSDNKAVPSKFLYDHRGSELFDKITQQPEYYQTTTELDIIEKNAKDIAKWIGPRSMIVEYGSGHSRKIRCLLECLDDQQAYVAVDISKEFLLQVCHILAKDFPNLDVMAVCADFLQPFDLPRSDRSVEKRVVFFPGSTIGNFEKPTALQLLENTAKHVGNGGGLLIGVDLKKDPEILNAAYNDRAGVTAEFELNILRRLNRELGANFNLEQFEYLGEYDQAMGRIEMSLVSTCAQVVEIAGKQISFAKGEKLHTENSYKYSLEEFADFARKAGFQSRQTWTDSNNLFSLHYLEVL